MTYHLRWKKTAQDQLITIWIDAADRRIVTEATNEVEYLLQTSPLDVGESRPKDRRILIVPPLVVVFRVSEEKQRVVVLSVRKLPSHH